MKNPNQFRTPNQPPVDFSITKFIPTPKPEQKLTEAHKISSMMTAEKQRTKLSTQFPKWKSTTSIDKPTNLLLLSGYGRSTTHNELRRLLNPDNNPTTKIRPSKNLTTLAYYDSVSAASKVKQTIDNARLGSILIIYLTLTPTKYNHDIMIYKRTGWNKNSNRRISKGTEIKKLLKQLEREQEILKPHKPNLPNYDSITEARNSTKIAHFLAGDSLTKDCWNEVHEKMENDQPLLQHSSTGVDIKAIINRYQQAPADISNSNQPTKPIQMGSKNSPTIHLQELRRTQARELIRYRNQVKNLQHTRLQRRQRLQKIHPHPTNKPKLQSTSQLKKSKDPRSALYAFQDPSQTKQQTTSLMTTRAVKSTVGHPCFNDCTPTDLPPVADTSQQAQNQASQDSITQTSKSKLHINPDTSEYGTDSYRSTTLKLTPPKLLTPQEILMPPKQNDITPRTSNSTISKLNQPGPLGNHKLEIDPTQALHHEKTSPQHKPISTTPPTSTATPTEATTLDSQRNSQNNTNQQTPPPQTTFPPGTFIQHLISLFLRFFNWGWEGHKQRTHDSNQ